jgi:hypothetical protein
MGTPVFGSTIANTTSIRLSNATHLVCFLDPKIILIPHPLSDFFPMFFLRHVMVALVKNLSMCAQSVVAIKPLHVAEFRMISIAIWQSSS